MAPGSPTPRPEAVLGIENAETVAHGPAYPEALGPGRWCGACLGVRPWVARPAGPPEAASGKTLEGAGRKRSFQEEGGAPGAHVTQPEKHLYCKKGSLVGAPWGAQPVKLSTSG